MVSGALDRLHYEKDPCVKYDIGRKLWIYLHRDRSQEEFGKRPHKTRTVLLVIIFLTGFHALRQYADEQRKTVHVCFHTSGSHVLYIQTSRAGLVCAEEVAVSGFQVLLIVNMI